MIDSNQLKVIFHKPFEFQATQIEVVVDNVLRYSELNNLSIIAQIENDKILFTLNNNSLNDLIDNKFYFYLSDDDLLTDRIQYGRLPINKTFSQKKRPCVCNIFPQQNLIRFATENPLTLYEFTGSFKTNFLTTKNMNLNLIIEDYFKIANECNNYDYTQIYDCYMNFIKIVTEYPEELFDVDDLSSLAIMMSHVASSNFCCHHPKYFDWNTGKIICSIGFYAFMKQLEYGSMKNSDIPHFVSLIHNGRTFLSEIFDYLLAVLNYSEILGKPINEHKGNIYIKEFECLMIFNCEKNHTMNNNLTNWKKELITELDYLSNSAWKTLFAKPLDCYKLLKGKLHSKDPFNFEL